MYALKRGIEAVYQLESDELAVEPLPGRTGDHAWSRLLFFEAAEGGAGVLRRLATEDGQLPIVARKALEILHFDPDTGADRHRAEYARENCAQACYDCLLSYANQWDHQHLDRHNATELLRRLTRATVAVGAGGEERPTQLARLKQLSNSLEQHFLDLLEDPRLPAARRRPTTRRRLLRATRLRLPHRRNGRRGVHRRPRSTTPPTSTRKTTRRG